MWTVVGESGGMVTLRCDCGATAHVSPVVARAPRKPVCRRCDGTGNTPAQPQPPQTTELPQQPAAPTPRPNTVANEWRRRSDSRMFVGAVFGRLTVIGRSTRRRYCIVRCECGVERESNESGMLNGEILSCGCGRYRRFVSGARIGTLTVIDVPARKRNMARLDVACDCGNRFQMWSARLPSKLRAADARGTCTCGLTPRAS